MLADHVIINPLNDLSPKSIQIVAIKANMINRMSLPMKVIEVGIFYGWNVSSNMAVNGHVTYPNH